jgi:hypothetical protein
MLPAQPVSPSNDGNGRNNYPTSWKIKHQLMEAAKDRDGQYFLRGIIYIDDAYSGGELNGGNAGRGAENKMPFVAALEMSDEHR